MEDKRELKACPFCEREPKTYWDDDTFGYEEGYNIYCDCTAGPHVCCMARDDAVNIWNIRRSILFSEIKIAPGEPENKRTLDDVTEEKIKSFIANVDNVLLSPAQRKELAKAIMKAIKGGE